MKSKLLAILTVALCTYFPAHAGKKKSSKAKTQTESCKVIETSPPLEPKTEFERLAINLTKYGNNPEGLPALHYAILQEDTEAVDLFLKYGASPYAKDGRMPDKRGIGEWRNSLYYALKTGNVDILKMLLNLGADLNDIGSSNNSAIINAVLFSHPECFKFLITNGMFSLKELNESMPFVTNRAQFTPEQKIEILQLMLDQGACIGKFHCYDPVVAEFIKSLQS